MYNQSITSSIYFAHKYIIYQAISNANQTNIAIKTKPKEAWKMGKKPIPPNSHHNKNPS